MNAICGDCFASVAIRSCFVDTLVEFRGIRHVSQERFHDPTPCFPPLVPAGSRSPASSVLSGAMTSCRPSRRASLPSLGGTSGFTRCVCSWADECAAKAWSCSPGSSSREYRRGNDRISQVLGEPQLSVCTCSLPTPAGPHAPDHYSAAAWPLVIEWQRLLRKVFRRSIAWLSDSLSTLRSAGRPAPRKTRFRPLVKRYRTGFHPQGSDERFQTCILHVIPLSQTSLAQSM